MDRFVELDSLNVSYTLGQTASGDFPASILSTDRNVNDSSYDTNSATEACWDADAGPMHGPGRGNLLLSDGSVHALNNAGLRGALSRWLNFSGSTNVEFLHPPGLVWGSQT